RAELADSHGWLGDLLAKQRGREGEADGHYRAALGLYRELDDRHPRTEPYLRALADVSSRLADLHRRHPPPPRHQFQGWVAVLHQGPLQSLAPLLLARDHLGSACRLLDDAIRYQEQARVLGNDHPRYHNPLFDHHRKQAEVLLAMGRHARAARV